MVLGFVDALDAEGAFLHHPAHAHGDIGIEEHLQRRALVGVVVEEVEAADLVRAVV
jgi:hypothetical protein